MFCRVYLTKSVLFLLSFHLNFLSFFSIIIERKELAMQRFEDQNIEFKQEYVKDIRKEVVAFANSEGGTVLIGIRKDGEVSGVDDPDEVML